MSHSDGDIPPGVDFLSEQAAKQWAEEAEAKLPSRINFFAAFADAIMERRSAIRQALEIGSGPGFLAEYILSRCAGIERYTLLDFSPTMLELSRKRLQVFGDRVAYLQVDFKQAAWADKVGAAYDCILTMQAVHELRHKRHALKFYGECRRLLKKDGLLLVCDHLPKTDSGRDRALFMTEVEQLDAIQSAGFSHVEMLFQTTERLACRAIE
ncbi:MAG TPA: class I SAM-dependent methyltransferase [Terriglobia bacterium]|jgi:ubiquinone/menaquinone biosynthesis C-methylase UbiE